MIMALGRLRAIYMEKKKRQRSSPEQLMRTCQRRCASKITKSALIARSQRPFCMGRTATGPLSIITRASDAPRERLSESCCQATDVGFVHS